MVQLTVDRFVSQVLEERTYDAKLVEDGTMDVEEYDFSTRTKTGNMVKKYYADLAIDGVEDENKRGQVYVKRLFFTISVHEKAALPKFLRGIRVPVDNDTGSFDTTPAVGKRWVTLDVIKYLGDGNVPKNKINAYIPCQRKAGEVPVLDAVMAWGDEDQTFDEAIAQ